MIVPLSLIDFEQQIISIVIIFSLAGIAGMTYVLLEIFNPRIGKRIERAERKEKTIRKHFGVEEGIKGVKYRKFKLVGYIKGLESKLILFYEHKRTREKITVFQEGYRKEKGYFWRMERRMNQEKNVTGTIKKIKGDKYNELVEQLKDKDKERRLYIINELAELGDDRAEEPLTDLLEQELYKIDCLPRLERLDKYMQYYADSREEMLIVKIDRAIDKVASGLFDYVDTAWEMDRMMLDTLDKLANRKEEKAIDFIIEIIELEQPEENKEYVRYGLVEALGKIGGMKAETILVEYALKEEEDQEGSSAAAWVLKKWGGEYTAEKMQKVLENEVEHYLFLRQIAIEILGRAYHPRSIEVLEKTLEKTSVNEERREIFRSISRLRREEQKAQE